MIGLEDVSTTSVVRKYQKVIYETKFEEPIASQNTRVSKGIKHAIKIHLEIP